MTWSIQSWDPRCLHLGPLFSASRSELLLEAFIDIEHRLVARDGAVNNCGDELQQVQVGVGVLLGLFSYVEAN